MKLEIKHLAPYLPHRINLAYTHTNKVGQISNIYSIGAGYDNEDIKISIDYSDGEHIWMYKPILRPLSDLTKGDWDKIFTTDDIDDILTIFQSDKSMDCVEYYLVNILLSYHFDIFGLVEEGLALDINTINK